MDTAERSCDDCNLCMLKSCAWKDGQLQEGLRPDLTGWLARRSPVHQGLYTAIDLATADGASFASSDVQAALSGLAAEQDSLVLMMDTSGNPLGIVGSEAKQQQFLQSLVQEQPRLAAALVDDSVAGRMDREVLSPAAVRHEQENSRLVPRQAPSPTFVISGSALNPVLETIQEAG
jgi:hypothetical protein